MAGHGAGLARGAARSLLEAPVEERPELWDELVSLGWLGLHLPEQYGVEAATVPRDVGPSIERLGPEPGAPEPEEGP